MLFLITNVYVNSVKIKGFSTYFIKLSLWNFVGPLCSNCIYKNIASLISDFQQSKYRAFCIWLIWKVWQITIISIFYWSKILIFETPVNFVTLIIHELENSNRPVLTCCLAQTWHEKMTIRWKLCVFLLDFKKNVETW